MDWTRWRLVLAGLGTLVLVLVAFFWLTGRAPSHQIEREGMASSLEGSVARRLGELKAAIDAALREARRPVRASYAVDRGATGCRPNADDAIFVCHVLLIAGEVRLTLTYYVLTAEGDCWEATPKRLELADGRRLRVTRTGLPPLRYCVSWKNDSLPPPRRESGLPGIRTSATCAGSYPEFCIPPPQPDFDCPDLPTSNFVVEKSGGDPHNFDRDGDGIGCERELADLRPPAVPPPRALLRGDCVKPVERPKKVILTCADGGVYVDDLRWKDWGKDVAVGVGTATANQCKPSCAEGTPKTYPGARLSASRLRSCVDGDRQYTFLTYAFSGESPFPPGSPGATDPTVSVPCPGIPPPAKGPTGELGTSSVGPVKVGMPSEEAEKLFGRPDRKEPVNLGGGPAPRIDWIWDLDEGEFRLQFETKRGTVTGYVSDTAQLATKSGVSVGDSFALIRDEYGDQLEESMVGEGSYLLSEGEPGSYPALNFSVEGDTISSISGGEFQAAGE